MSQGCAREDVNSDSRVTMRSRSGPNTIAGAAQGASYSQNAQNSQSNGPGGVRGDYAGSAQPFGGVTGPDASAVDQRGSVERLGLPSDATPTSPGSRDGAADREAASAAVDSARQNNTNAQPGPSSGDTTFTGPRGGTGNNPSGAGQSGGSSGAGQGGSGGASGGGTGGGAGGGGAGG
jgi:hypothetical protein